MANKNFVLNDGLAVTVYKRRTSRNLRLSINAHGQVRVTIPSWAPYRAGLEFARSRQGWIITQQKPVMVLTDGRPVGKAHHLKLVPGDKLSTRLLGGSVIVRYPPSLGPDALEVQK